MSFEEYWETDGSRKDAADHKERARLAWEAGQKAQAEETVRCLEMFEPKKKKDPYDLLEDIVICPHL